MDDSVNTCMRCGHTDGKLYCLNCKKELKKDSAFCEYCGAKVSKIVLKSPEVKKSDDEFKPSKIKCVLALVFAIFALSVSIYAALPYSAFSGLVFMIVWYCLSTKMRNSYINEMNQPENGLTMASKIISVISIPVCIVACIISIAWTMSLGEEFLDFLS